MKQAKKDGLKIGGIAHAVITVPTDEAHKAVIRGMFVNADGRTGPHGFTREDNADGTTTLTGHLHNAFVNQGLGGILDSAFGDLVADRITHIGLSADTAAVTAGTTDLDPAGNGTGTSIKTTDNTSRSVNTVSCDQTWTQADVSFAIAKIGLLRGSSSTDVSNIIGGTGGSSPYDEPFTIDLTSIATWTLTMGIDVTATAS